MYRFPLEAGEDIDSTRTDRQLTNAKSGRGTAKAVRLPVTLISRRTLIFDSFDVTHLTSERSPTGTSEQPDRREYTMLSLLPSSTTWLKGHEVVHADMKDI